MFDSIKVWYSRVIRSKTMWFSLLLAVFGAIQATMGAFHRVLTPEVYGLLTMGIGVIVAILRYVTTTSLKDK